MSATADYRLSENAHVVSDVRSYNSWPMIQSVGKKLFCSYSPDNNLPANGHTITPGSRDSYMRTSSDGGRTWSQRIVEKDLSVKEWVTEPSLVDLGGGRLLIVGRCEQNLGNQFQETRVDGGKTWKKSRTNIGRLLGSK